MGNILFSSNYMLISGVVHNSCYGGRTIQHMAELGPGTVGIQDSWKNFEWRVYFDIHQHTYQRYGAWSDSFKEIYRMREVSILPVDGTTQHIDGFEDLLDFARAHLCPDVFYAEPKVITEAELGVLIMNARERVNAESMRWEKEMILRAFDET